MKHRKLVVLQKRRLKAHDHCYYNAGTFKSTVLAIICLREFFPLSSEQNNFGQYYYCYSVFFPANSYILNGDRGLKSGSKTTNRVFLNVFETFNSLVVHRSCVSLASENVIFLNCNRYICTYHHLLVVFFFII